MTNSHALMMIGPPPQTPDEYKAAWAKLGQAYNRLADEFVEMQSSEAAERMTIAVRKRYPMLDPTKAGEMMLIAQAALFNHDEDEDD